MTTAQMICSIVTGIVSTSPLANTSIMEVVTLKTAMPWSKPLSSISTSMRRLRQNLCYSWNCLP